MNQSVNNLFSNAAAAAAAAAAYQQNQHTLQNFHSQNGTVSNSTASSNLAAAVNHFSKLFPLNVTTNPLINSFSIESLLSNNNSNANNSLPKIVSPIGSSNNTNSKSSATGCYSPLASSPTQSPQISQIAQMNDLYNSINSSSFLN